MQRKHQQSSSSRDRVARPHRAPNLHRPRQESKNVAGVPSRNQQLHRILHLGFERFRRVRQMFDRKIEQRSGRTQDRTAAKIFRYGLGIESRRHHHDSQLGRVRCSRFNNASARSLSRWRSWNSSSTTASTPFSDRIRKQPAGKHPLGNKSQPRAGPDRFFKPDLVTNGLADRLRRVPMPLDAPPAAPQSGAVRAPPLRRSRFQAAPVARA